MLSDQTPQIRLLTLCPGNFNDPLKGKLSVIALDDLERGNGDILHWEALSYCWGNRPSSEILRISHMTAQAASDKALYITPSLHLALRHIRLKSRERTIWIDQTCVNQNDLEERARQIQHMSFIYTKADNVIAWIGSGDPDSLMYMEMLSVISGLMDSGMYPRKDRPTHEEEDRLFEALTLKSMFRNSPIFTAVTTHDAKRQYLASLCRTFCRSPWFERLWIVQEAVLAKHLVLQYGDKTIEWHVHAKACLELLWKDLSVDWTQLSGSGIGLTDTIEMLKDTDYGSSSRRLVVLLNALKCQKTSDARDRIYGLMGMAELQKPQDGDTSIIVDYEITAEELSEQLTLYCLETEGTTDVLSMCCAGAPEDHSERASWAINLAHGGPYCDNLFRTELRTMDIFSAGISQPIQHQYSPSTKVLSLIGIELDSIQQVSKQNHSSKHYGNPGYDTWSEWKAIALEELDPDIYTCSAGRREAFWRTLITNQIWSDDLSEYVKAPTSVGIEFERWLHRLDLKSTSEARNAAQASEVSFYTFVANLMVGNQAHLFRTRRGYIGLACKHVKAGDKIVVFWGSHLPSILREVESRTDRNFSATDPADPKEARMTYKIIGGQIYVHGLMDNEVENDASKAREFHII